MWEGRVGPGKTVGKGSEAGNSAACRGTFRSFCPCAEETRQSRAGDRTLSKGFQSFFSFVVVIHSFSRYLLSTYSIQGTVTAPGDTAENRHTLFSPSRAYILLGDQYAHNKNNFSN